jgi:acyl carrier protein
MNEKIINTMAEHLGLAPQDIDKEALLREDLGLGPVELSDLLNELSQKFDVTFNPEDMAGLQSVEDLIVLVEDNSIE